jgi:phi LC3 family holin
MKINWKARFKNKTFVVTFVTLVVTFVYQVLGLFGVVPTISENTVMNLLTMVVNLLAGLGVLADPTTPGVVDSDRAMTYYTESDVREVEE